MTRDDFFNHPFYKPIEQKYWNGYSLINRFRICPKCEHTPRVWVFDNGNFCKCSCFDLFGNGVEAENIMQHYKANGGSIVDYNGAEKLIEKWNKHIQEMEL